MPIPSSRFWLSGTHCQWQFATNILKWKLFHTLWYFESELFYIHSMSSTYPSDWTPWDHPPSRGPRTSLIRLESLITKAATIVTGAMVRNFTIEELNSQCHDFEGQTTSSDVLTASFRLSDHPVAVSSGQNLPWKNRTQSLVISSWFPITIEKPTTAIFIIDF